MKTIICLMTAFLALSANTSLAEEKADLSTDAKSPEAFAAVATAVSAVGRCRVPLVFEEKLSKGSRVLGVHCRATEDEQLLLPVGFDYAG